jgi:type IV fimbrial biogenesis protein FimT
VYPIRLKSIARRRFAAGFTAVELLATISIVAITAAVAVPSMRSFIQNNRAATDSNALVSALVLARSESVTRGVPVSVCSSKDGATCSGEDDWSRGWIVFTDPNDPVGRVDDGDPVDDEVLRAFPALNASSAMTGDADFVAYNPTGFLNADAEVAFGLAVEGCVNNHNRSIAVNLQGRPAVSAVACAGGYE